MVLATDFCQTSTCSDGSFYFLDWEACEHCYYSVFDDPEHTDNNAVIGDKYDSPVLTAAKSTGANALLTIRTFSDRNGNAPTESI